MKHPQIATSLQILWLPFSAASIGQAQTANQTRAAVHDNDTGDKAYIIGCTAANSFGAAGCTELPGSKIASDRISLNKTMQLEKEEQDRQRAYQRSNSDRPK